MSLEAEVIKVLRENPSRVALKTRRISNKIGGGASPRKISRILIKLRREGVVISEDWNHGNGGKPKIHWKLKVKP